MREMRSSELGSVRAGIQTHGVLLQPACLSFKLWFSSVKLLSRVQLFVTPWTAAHQASLSITNSWSLFKLMSIESVMPSNHLILCCPLLLPPSILPSLMVFSSESSLRIRWPNYWSFSFSISPSNEHPGPTAFRMDCLDLLAVQGTLKSLLQHHSLKASILRCSAFFMLETRVWYLGREDCLEKEMAIHSSSLAWKIPWIEPGRLQSMESQRVGHDWATLLTYSFLYSPTLTSIHEHGKTLTVLQTLASQCFGLLSISQTNLVGLHGGHGKSLVWDLLSFRGLWNIQVVSGR